MSDPVLLLISGSLRQEATNRKLAHEAARLFGPAKVIEGNLNLPLYDGDLEEAEGIPAAVQALAVQVAEADAVVISTPEYNRAPSGVLKNGKPVAVMSAAAGRSGGENAQMILRSFLVPFQPHVLPGPAVHLAESYNAFDAEGHLSGEEYRKILTDLMTQLRAATLQRT
ncbi:NADPH-dependent FMN reductase [Phaeobacter sp. HF9A]|uniref:NADPH-dependent FMN reductase n=1 Tax=Phaeobacter sp. HF9A TaxID=2721561 RepID=UPI0014300502|nr:NADPH-dependent FMN reductase [Phaeobacter sp. HF9A]NIZ15742.1 NAD(P)H-dependent oxidoreductase [Phaeobacter sp. HF9A]